MADYIHIPPTDQDLPPPPEISDITVEQIPVSFPPPPIEATANDVAAVKDKTTAIKGIQLVKVSGLKLSEEELAGFDLIEGDLYLATEAAGLYEQWQVWKPVQDAEKKFVQKKALVIIDKNNISKNEKFEIIIKSLQSTDTVLLEACLSQSIFTPLQRGLTSEGGCLYHLAATQASPQILQHLIARKIIRYADLMQRDKNGSTMLHSAAIACKTESMEVIVDSIVSTDNATAITLINARDNTNTTALALSIQNQNREGVNLLLRTGLCNYSLVNIEGETVFHLTCRMDDVDTIRALIGAFLDTEPLQESKIGLKDAITNQSPTGAMPITLSHSVEMIKLLLPYYELNSTEYTHQSTLLHVSVNNNNFLLTDILLEERALPNTANSLGHTPLMQACRAGNKEITAMLLEKNADPEIILKNSASESECTGTAIEMAAQNGHIECVKLLLQYNARVNGEELTAANRIGALHASCSGGDDQMVNFFLTEQGMDANQLNSSGYTPLFYSVNGGHYSVTELLLTSGADASIPIPHSKDKSTVNSLLHLVIEKDNDKLLALLLAHSKADNTDSLVDLAVRLDRNKLLSQLLTSNQDILQSGRQTGSLLHKVVTYNSIGSLSYLLRRLTKSCSQTAIHFQLFERKATIFSTKESAKTFPVTLQKSVFELTLDQKSEEMLNLLLKHLRDPEYFQDNKALLHSMLDKQLFGSLKTAMDTMLKCNQDKVILQTSYLDSDSTGLLPTNPDYQESDLSLLHKIATCPDQDIVYHPTVAAAVSYKLPYYRGLFVLGSIVYIIFLIFYTLALHRASYYCDADLFNYANDPFRLISEIIIGIYFVVYIAYEVLNFLIEWDPLRGRYTPSNKCSPSTATYLVETTNAYRIVKFTHRATKRNRHMRFVCWYKLNAFTRGLFCAIISYFSNIFRFLSFFSLIFMFLFFMMRLGISSSQWTFAALSLLFFYLLLAEYSKIFPCFYSYLLRILRATFQSLPPFLVLLSICVLAFVLSGHLLIQQDAIQGVANASTCIPQQNYFNDMYTGTNRLFVSSIALLIQSGISNYENEFVFTNTNWVLLLFLLCFGFVFAILLPAFLLAHILFTFTQQQGCLTVQRSKLDIIYRTELHSGFAFLFGRRVRASTCVNEVVLSDSAFNHFIDKVGCKRESEILISIKSQIGRVLYTNQNFLHKRSLSPPIVAMTTDKESDTSLSSLIEQLRTDLQGNSTQTNKCINSMFQKMNDLDSRVTSIYDYLTGFISDFIYEMIAALLEATEMIGIPILLVTGFVLIVVLALLMVILRKEKTYEEIVREREMKLGDIGDDKSAKVTKKKIQHKPKRPDNSNLAPTSEINISEPITSEEEITIILPEKISPKPNTKQKKTKKQVTETSSLPPDLSEEIVVTGEVIPPITESLPVVSSPQYIVEDAPVKKKGKSKTKPKKEEVPTNNQNGDINWTKTNGHESDQFHFLTNQVNKLNLEKDEILTKYKDLSAENRLKDNEINRLNTDLNDTKVQFNQQINSYKNENTRINQQLQNTAAAQANTVSRMQEELERRKSSIDTMRSQHSALKSQHDAQLQQMQTTLDKKEVEKARMLQDRDATREELNEANLSIASLTTSCKKLERQFKEIESNSPSNPSIERELNDKICSLQNSLEASEKEAKEKYRLEDELQQKQECITQQQIAIDKLNDDQSKNVTDDKITEYEEKIGELNTQLEDWEDSIKSLNSEMFKLRQESVPATEVEQLQSELSEKETQINRLTALVEKSQQKVNDIGDIMNEFQDLKQKTQDLQIENDILQARNESSGLDDSSVADLASNHAIQQATIEEMKLSFTELESKLEKKEEELAQSLETNTIIQERLDTFKKKNNELRENVWKINDDIDNARKSAEQDSKSTHQQIQGFSGQIFPNLRAHGQDFEDWLGKMKGAATDYLYRLEEDNKTNTEALNESGIEAEKEREKVKDLLVRDKIQTEENETLKKTIKETQEEILLLQNQVEQEFTRLKGELSVEQRRALDKEMIIGEKENELSNSQQLLENLNQETESLKKSVVPELEKSLKKRDSEIQELTYQMDSISQRKDKLEHDLASTQRQSSDQMERTNSLQAENDSLFGMSEIIQGYKKDLADAQHLIKLLQSNQANPDGTNQTDLTVQLHQELNVMTDKFRELQEENEILKQQKREFETQTDLSPNSNNNNAIESPKIKKEKVVKSPKMQRQPSETTAL
ncbi:Serine/threonine-protein phosphatase 6 regulatory ankyrin repeat subunit B-like [Oopsacas minuta]|uniref:Serine/threonine-protein phosphatase 6 regulatory ankyrin repeat subunit B-like n=1 Tax=Oopsacas minuta TaxID=111878 RepID=A0AAV7JG17_9METZ|nr:Serine/threonine-protein phosphatase 6 regulatory ankyrin repeat subunit B-like [Oopsacas minuta]